MTTPLERKFKFGQLLLDDPDPESSPEDAVRVYEATYPVIANCTLSGPEEEGGHLVYTLVKPAATTKGKSEKNDSDELEQALAELDAWQESQSAGLTMPNNVTQSLAQVIENASRKSTDNPLDIPLA
jgi:PRTRC genetic system protein C